MDITLSPEFLAKLPEGKWVKVSFQVLRQPSAVYLDSPAFGLVVAGGVPTSPAGSVTESTKSGGGHGLG